MIAFRRVLTSMAALSFTVVVAAAAMALAAAVPAGPVLAQAGAGESAVLLAYQRFGQGTNPANRVRIDQFDAHVKELTNGRYAVMPVPDILEAIVLSVYLPKAMRWGDGNIRFVRPIRWLLALLDNEMISLVC